MSNAVDIVNLYYDLSNKKLAGLREMKEMFAEDIEFVGPLNRISGAKQFLALLEQFLPAHEGYRLHKQFEDGDHVCSIYDLLMKSPSGKTVSITMADWIRVSNGKIAEQKLYYDPRDMMKAFGM